ncbi:iron-hydroxamate ABC transporter substrate-binding protein [Saccharibacillus kuerlensis]|uniref:Iron(3+)-hydroxamate-binding protein FhuD n=1 Tax=Saccharibacillus kuerlensis TaxID=459527 RepID=A0ABQ2KWH2_9BACL|nr:iron-hydroxamate ABC transporter substrate-binding protein [Saccharibacillus kuerlensis]GGN92632.1 iron(3+)-hydroxamate-binding protein FhuD [Saccharibacillus kuerlensis]
MKTWRKLGFLLGTVLLLIMLAACGNQTDTAATDTQTQNESAVTDPATAPAEDRAAKEAAADDSETIVYAAANGDITIPKNPKRIVVIADSYFGDFVQLGITPVGAPDHVFQSAVLKEKTDGVTNIGDGSSVESVLGVDPDLIIVWVGNENLEKFSKIAPTVAFEYGKLNTKERMLEFGRMTNRESEAQAWVDSWDSRIAELKPEVQAAVGDKTVSILQPYDKGIYVMGDTFGRGGEILYQELELKAPAGTQKEAIDSGAGFASISLETLEDFAGDYIFTAPWQSADDGPAVYNSSIWKNLPGVKAGQVFEIDPVAYYFNDPISLDSQLTFITDSLLGK